MDEDHTIEWESKQEEKKEQPETETFIKRGENLILKKIVNDMVLKPKDIVENWDRFNSQLHTLQNQKAKTEESLVIIGKNMEAYQKKIDQLSPHVQRAVEICSKEAKSAILEVKAECLRVAKAEYKPDVAATADLQRAELFNNWRYKIHTHAKVGRSHNFPESILKSLLYGDKPIIDPKEVGI